MEGRKLRFSDSLKLPSIGGWHAVPNLRAARVHVVEREQAQVLVVPAEAGVHHTQVQPRGCHSRYSGFNTITSLELQQALILETPQEVRIRILKEPLAKLVQRQIRSVFRDDVVPELSVNQVSPVFLLHG